jgi:hypothetical protein
MAGGLIGELQTGSAPKMITHSYSTGLVTAPGDHVHGFMGYNSGGIFDNNFWDQETSGQTGSDPAATGKPTAQMKTLSTFTGADWDFDEVWAIDPTAVINDGYPYLQWQLSESLPGDANCDGTVNGMDVTTIINYFLGLNPQPFCFDNADVNGDNEVNVQDVVITIAMVLGGKH